MVPQFVAFGYPLGVVNMSVRGWCISPNYSSATANMGEVTSYIEEEIARDSVMGPFQSPPFDNFVSNPMLTAPKKDTDKLRVVHDLSSPLGASVNCHTPKSTYLGEPIKVTLPAMSDISKLIVRHGRGCHMYVIDLARAYRNLKVDPADIHMLGMEANGNYYVDLSVPFGCRHGAAFCSQLSKLLMQVHTRDSVRDGCAYIDDLFGLTGSLVDAERGFDDLRNLLEFANFPPSPHKQIPPAQEVVYIGILWNSVQMTAALTINKRAKLVSLIDKWLLIKTANLHQLQKLCGSLLYAAQMVPYTRSLLNSALNRLRLANTTLKVPLTAEFKYDLQWFRAFLVRAIYPFTLLPHEREDVEIECDACLTGAGAIYNGKEAYSARFDSRALAFAHDVYIQDCPECAAFAGLHQSDCKLCISVLELLNCVGALHMWASKIRGKRVTILCDNMPSVLALKSGKSKSRNMARVLRNAHLFAAYSDISLTARHVPGVDMVLTDALSRRGLGIKFDTVVDSLFKSGVVEVHPPSDLFHLDFAIATPPGQLP
jgi:hypothetical protein